MTSTCSAAATGLPTPILPTDRRTLLTGGALAAIVAASALPAGAATNLDAGLLRLRAKYDRTREIWEESSPAHSRAETAHVELRRAEPDRSDDDLRTASGLAEAEDVYYGLLDENVAVLAAMTETPALTFAGLIAKAEVCEIETCNVPDLANSIVADLLAMKPRTA